MSLNRTSCGDAHVWWGGTACGRSFGTCDHHSDLYHGLDNTSAKSQFLLPFREVKLPLEMVGSGPDCSISGWSLRVTERP